MENKLKYFNFIENKIILIAFKINIAALKYQSPACVMCFKTLSKKRKLAKISLTVKQLNKQISLKRMTLMWEVGKIKYFKNKFTH